MSLGVSPRRWNQRLSGKSVTTPTLFLGCWSDATSMPPDAPLGLLDGYAGNGKMEAHMAYLVERLPELSPNMLLACRELRARFPMVRKG